MSRIEKLKAREAYETAERQAWDDYVKAKQQAGEAYEKATQQAFDAYVKVKNEARDVYEKATQQGGSHEQSNQDPGKEV